MRPLFIAVLLFSGFSPARAWDWSKPFIYEMRIAFETDNWINMYSTATVLSKSGNTEAFRVVANSTTSPTYQLVVTTQGNVGISTGNPTQRFEVTGTIYSNSGGFKFPDGSTQTKAVALPELQEGDILYYINGALSRLPMGSDGQSLKTVNQTKLLLHMDGTDGSTTFTDSTGKTVTANGNAQIDTAQSKLGGASVLFDGDGDYLSLADSDDWNFGSGDFTVDFWVNFNALDGYKPFIGQTIDAGNYCIFYLEHLGGNNYLRFAMGVGGVDKGNYVAPLNVATGEWHHVAYVRSGTAFKIFLDGVSQTLTVITAIGANSTGDWATTLNIGYLSNVGYLNGWLDEVRISKGVARWTADFTPPTSPYTAAPSLVWSN